MNLQPFHRIGPKFLPIFPRLPSSHVHTSRVGNTKLLRLVFIKKTTLLYSLALEKSYLFHTKHFLPTWVFYTWSCRWLYLSSCWIDSSRQLTDFYCCQPLLFGPFWAPKHVREKLPKWGPEMRLKLSTRIVKRLLGNEKFWHLRVLLLFFAPFS